MKRILLMDDSPTFLEVTTLALQSAGYEVVCVNDLITLDKARKLGKSDLVLMDVHMPEAFGEDIACLLRDSGTSAPIYLLSSLEETDLAERAQWARIDGYISKEIGIDAIIARVRDILPADA